MNNTMRYLLLFLFTIFISKINAQLKVITTLCENKQHPLGVSTKNIHFGWEMTATGRSQNQNAYQVVIASSEKNIRKGIYDIWNSAVVKSKQSVLVRYNGKSLKPAKLYYWRVKVWDKSNIASSWSAISSFCTGLENAEDWQSARWIGYEDLDDSMRVAPGIHAPDALMLKYKCLQRPVIPLLRKDFTIAKRVASAFAFISGLGQYELSINGKKSGDGFLTPGWTYYDKRCLYNVLDITQLLKYGDNCIGVILGNGFFNINRERYFKLVDAFGMPKLICRAKINYEDGSSSEIVTDQSWKAAPSPITFTSIYGGEDYDARLEQPGWDKPLFNDKNWKSAELVKAPKGQLVADMDYPVAVMDSFQVKKITEPKSSVFVYDFGQNVSGIPELKIKGHKGQTVKLIPAEILFRDGRVNQGATGNPYYLSYTLKSDSVETWRPRFTYYGFRFVQVEGTHPEGYSNPSIPVIVNLTSLHTRNSSPSNGSFSCSNKLFNRIYTLINWAIKSNFQSVITDCPHREKLSWLEQDYLMGASINYNFDNYSLYHKLVFDLMDAQNEKGFVPDIAPEYVKFDGGFLDSPEWGSTAVIMPWLLYSWYQDEDIVQQAYPMMKKYVQYLESKSDRHLLSYGLGDWFDYGPGRPGEAQLTPKALTATAIYYYDVLLLSKMAAVLKQNLDAQNYQQLARKIKSAFNSKFFNNQTNVYATGSQRAMAIPLSIGLVNEQNRKAVLANLCDSITFHHYALTAGDIGFHFLIDALDNGGQSQVVYEMNNRDDVPGYGYQLKKGATALTESWPALERVSNNHLMLGHIMEWFYSGLAGISQENSSSGFQTVKIRPQPVGNILSANGTFHTPYGWVKTSWKKDGGRFLLDIVIPPNAKANVYLPANKKSSIYENGQLIKVRKLTEEVKIPCGSGQYRFEVK